MSAQQITVGTKVIDAITQRVYNQVITGTVTKVDAGEPELLSVVWDNDPTGEPEHVWAEELTVNA